MVGARPKLRSLWLGLLTAALLLAGVLVWRLRQTDEPTLAPPPPTSVTAERLQSRPVQSRSEFVGALEAQERVTVRSEVEGRISQIFVENGDQITAGTPILQLIPDRPEAVVSGAIADIELARATRNSAQAQLLEAEADRDSALADKNLQDTEFNRTESLVAAGALAQQNLDQVVRNRESAIAALNAAERRIQSAQAQLAESVAGLRRAESQAAVATEDLSDYQIVAPIDGSVGDLPVKVGDYVSQGAELTTLTRNQSLDLRLSIPVEHSAALRPGLPVELRMEASDEPLVTGQISFVAARVEEGAQSILAKATFPNPGNLLRDEQFVRAAVIWEEQPGVMVPTTAISRVGGQSFVFVVEPSDETDSGYVAVQRPIQLGVIEGNRYEVTQGLSNGDNVVTSGILRLSDSAPITLESQ